MRHCLLLSLLMAVAMPAMAVYKCASQGRITYTDIPCGPTQTMLPPAPVAADAAAAKQQAASERRQLAAIEKTMKTEHLASEREGRRRKPDKTEMAHKKKCIQLGLERKWSAEDADAAPHTVSTKTHDLKKTARRKAERYEAECGNGS